MLDDDHGDGVHNHMCPYITIILRGGYWEQLKTESFGENRVILVFVLQMLIIELI